MKLSEKVSTAIQRLKSFEPEEGYFLAFSGGKDSVVIKALAEMAGVKYEAHYHVTSVDQPELVRFIKTHYSDVKRDIPHDREGRPITMWNLIARRTMPPTRLARYCCTSLKESAGKGKLTITGVRWAESVRRKTSQALINVFHSNKDKRIYLHNDNDESRKTVEHCFRLRKTLLNPIIDWEDDDVWDFIRGENIPYCKLYDPISTGGGVIRGLVA